MRTVIIRNPARRRSAAGALPACELLELGPGQQATFGRGGAGTPVDVVLPDVATAPLAGRITAVGDHWVVSNLSGSVTIVVESPEGGGGFVTVAPRRVDAPIPFEFARVVLPGTAGMVSFDVFAPEHTYTDEAARPGGTTALGAFSLDESATYFLVLVALCEPRLRDAFSSELPTTPGILERLRPLPACHDLTCSAVEFHIDYLASTKLRVEGARPSGPELGAVLPGARGRRASLVATAVRSGLVTEQHLALLPPLTR